MLPDIDYYQGYRNSWHGLAANKGWRLEKARKVAKNSRSKEIFKISKPWWWHHAGSLRPVMPDGPATFLTKVRSSLEFSSQARLQHVLRLRRRQI